jgi:hypothetical protein
VIVRARYRPAEPVPGEVVSAEARLLALAYAVEAAVEDGRFRSVAEVAKALGLSRSRLSQVMRRRWVAVGEQECVLGEGQRCATKRDPPKNMCQGRPLTRRSC